MQNYLSLFKHSQWVTNSPVVKGKIEVDTCTRIICLRHPEKQTKPHRALNSANTDWTSRSVKDKLTGQSAPATPSPSSQTPTARKRAIVSLHLVPKQVN